MVYKCLTPITFDAIHEMQIMCHTIVSTSDWSMSPVKQRNTQTAQETNSEVNAVLLSNISLEPSVQ